MNSGVAAVLFAIFFLAVTICAVYGAIKRKVNHFSTAVFGTESITEGLKRQAEELAATPKSVSGMTRIFEPQIQKDFPEFHLEEFKSRAQNRLILSLQTISGDAVFSEKAVQECPELYSQVSNIVRTNQTAGIGEHYEQIQIYQTEIANYVKRQGKCIITLQSAVGHIHYKEKNGIVVEGDKERLSQTKYNVDFMYIQDENVVGDKNAYGTTCPNCGAPITSLGAMHCEYCGSAVVPVNVKVWSMQRFCEVDYNHVS